jgi:hypothetical protein
MISPRTKAWLVDIKKHIVSRNGKLFAECLRECGLSRSDLESVGDQILKISNSPVIASFLEFLRLKSAHSFTDPLVLESLANCTRKLCSAYAEEDGQWLLLSVVFLLSLCRKTATLMDQPDSTKWRKKMVEILREIFPILHKERACLPGTAWLICQLLALYMALDQVKLCAHILAALSQGLIREGGFRPEMVPVPVGVTLYYLWGKFHLMDSKYKEAHEKLIWAFQNAKNPKHTKIIAQSLIPSMIAIGVFPKDMLFTASGCDHYVEITNAIRMGDLNTFGRLLDTHAQKLASAGTLLVMEKARRLCARNLAKRLSIAYKSVEGDNSKIELDVFFAGWKLAEPDSCIDEMICALADLIYSGEIKGYIALEHNKLVLSKANPFPAIDQLD